jgi:Flp pilus assembly CpaF family ATPase
MTLPLAAPGFSTPATTATVRPIGLERPVVTEPWPRLPEHCAEPAARLARVLAEERGDRPFTIEWERTLLERAHQVVEQALRAPQQHGLDHGAAQRFWEGRGPGGDWELLLASVVIRASMFWPLSLLVYGCRTAEDIKRAYGSWMWENVERTVVLRGGEPEEFRGRTPREVDERVTTWVKERVLSVEAPGARALTEITPTVTAVYPTAGRGPARFAAVVPPALAGVDGLALTVRVRREDGPETLEDLILAGALDEGAAEFLRRCVVARLNQAIAGDTGTGKTTLQAALCREIPDCEHVWTVEDGGAELELRSRVFRDGRPSHAWTTETTVVSSASRGEPLVSAESLIRQGLRQRPSRIMVPEARGGEFFEVLLAITSGHPGGITTLHARRLEEVPERMMAMVLRAQERPSEQLARHLINLGLEVCIFLVNRGGRHLVESIATYGESGAMFQVYERDATGILRRAVTHIESLPQRIQNALRPWGSEVPGL